jgi:hypothetical protein
VSGGGIGGSPPTLINTIVANNSPDNCSVAITLGSNNLQFPGTTCGMAIPTADPMLGPLTGGVYPLLAGSPAIDTGTNTGCPPTDELGTARPQGAACDIGAFEFVPADVTPPVIVANVAPPPNANGWNNTDVTVTWNVSDLESGIASSSGCGPTTLTSETAGTTLTCSATNGAGLSSSQSVTVKIDKTPPTVTYSGNAGVYTVDQTVNITCSASDNLSGVNSTTCADISGPAYSFGLGTHTFSATATDKAGNVGSGSTTFTVQVTYASLCALTQQFVTPNPDLGQSLCAKLSAAAAAAARGDLKAKRALLKAYRNEVRAQIGKALTAGEAAILIQLSQHL